MNLELKYWLGPTAYNFKDISDTKIPRNKLSVIAEKKERFETEISKLREYIMIIVRSIYKLHDKKDQYGGYKCVALFRFLF